MLMAKSVSPEGLGEIAAMKNEEVSIEMMQSVERFMRSHPSVWSESSVQHLLVVASLSLVFQVRWFLWSFDVLWHARNSNVKETQRGSQYYLGQYKIQISSRGWSTTSLSNISA